MIVGAGGAERIIEIDLNAAERNMFIKSVESVKGSSTPAPRSPRSSAPNFAAPGHCANIQAGVLHEHPRAPGQGALRQFGIPTPDGMVAFSAREADEAVQQLPGPLFVVKAQIHAGGRGKGKFKEAAAGEKGGVRLAKSRAEVQSFAEQMLGNTLVTAQTGADGRVVNRIYVSDGTDIERELYLSALVDRASSRVAFIASAAGGMDIEQVAHEAPEKIISVTIDPASGYMPFHGRRIAFAFGLEGKQINQCIKLVGDLYNLVLAKTAASGDQPADRVEGRQPVVPRRQDELRFQRALPPPGHRRHARSNRGGSDRGRGIEVRPVVCEARRHHRLHGQRRRPRHGDHGHHQALCAERRTSSTWRRRLEGKVEAAFKIILSDPAVKGILVNSNTMNE